MIRRLREIVNGGLLAALGAWWYHADETGTRHPVVGRIRSGRGGFSGYPGRKRRRRGRIPMTGDLAGKRSGTADDGSCEAEIYVECDDTLNRIAELSGTFLWQVDAGGTYTFVSRAAEALLGYPPGDLVGRVRLCDLHPDEGREAFCRVISEAFGREEPFRMREMPVRARNGAVRWFSVSAVPLFDDGGKLCGYRGTDTDVTDRKRAEVVERVQRAIADGIVSARTPDEVVGIARRELGELMDTRNFLVAEYDEAAKTLRTLPDLSRDEKELPACWSGERSLTGMVIRNGRAMRFTKADIRRLADEGIIDLVGARAEVWLGVPMQNNGSVFGAVILQSYGDPAAYDDVALEILQVVANQLSVYIEKMRAETEASAVRRQLRDIIDFLPDATLAVDREKRVIIWNRAMEEMTGIPASEMLGRGDYAYTVPFYGEKRPQLMDMVFGYEPATAELYSPIIRNGDVYEGEAFCPAMNGGRGGWIYARVSPLRDAEGKVVGAIESIRDISERKRFELLIAAKTKELERHQETLIASMAILAEYRDQGTGDHVLRTKEYFRLLLERSGGEAFFPSEHIPLLWQAATLHDIGKVGVPDMILLKPGKLTPPEFDIAKRHTTIGSDVLLEAARILGDAPFIVYARQITEFHHEKWDGSGYPHGLKGEDIPFIARVMAIADVYDALVSGRPYKIPIPHEEAVAIIVAGAGVHFDPRLVRVFLGCAAEFEAIARGST